MAVLMLPASAFAQRDAVSDLLAENAARERAESFLTEKGIAFERRSLLAERGGFGVSIHALIKPRLITEDSERITLVVAAPLGSIGKGARFGVEAALLFAERASRLGLPMDVRMALLADEAGELPADLRGEILLGSRDLADLYEDRERVAVVYLDLGDEARSPSIQHGAAGTLAPLGLLRPLTEAFAARGLVLPVAIPYNELYRLRLVAGPDPLAFLNGAGFQALLISNSALAERSRSSAPVSAEDFSAALYDFALSLSRSPAELDRRYTLFPLGFGIATIPEITSVALFLLAFAIGLAAILVYSITHRHLMIARGVVFLRRSWALGLFLAALFISLLSADFALSAAFRLFGAQAGGIGYGRAAVKLILALAAYLSFSPLLHRGPVPRRAHFYGAAAEIYFAAGVLVAAVIDFTFVPVFLWAFVLSVAVALIERPGIAFALATLAPLQIVGAAAAAAGSGDDRVALLLASNDPLLSLYLAFIILPFIFLFRRASALSVSRSGATHALRSRWARLLLLLGAALTAVVFAANETRAAAGAAEPVRVRLSETTGHGELAARMLRVTESDSPFLDRRSFVLKVEAEGRPSRIDLFLESGQPIPVYDSSVPFELSDDGLTASLRLSERPPQPLAVEFVLPRDLQAIVRARALYVRSPPSAPPRGDASDWALTVETNLEIGTGR